VNNYIYHALLYSGGIIRDLGSIGSNERTGANAINNLGIVVGSSFSQATGSQAFIFSAGLMKDLNILMTDPIPLNAPLPARRKPISRKPSRLIRVGGQIVDLVSGKASFAPQRKPKA
jgi:probable HAF family extracellular repeat protein